MKIILTETQVKKLIDTLTQPELKNTIRDPKEVIVSKKKNNGKKYITHRP
jgi:hypothetical protein